MFSDEDMRLRSQEVVLMSWIPTNAGTLLAKPEDKRKKSPQGVEKSPDLARKSPSWQQWKVCGLALAVASLKDADNSVFIGAVRSELFCNVNNLSMKSLQ